MGGGGRGDKRKEKKRKSIHRRRWNWGLHRNVVFTKYSQVQISISKNNKYKYKFWIIESPKKRGVLIFNGCFRAMWKLNAFQTKSDEILDKVFLSSTGTYIWNRRHETFSNRILELNMTCEMLNECVHLAGMDSLNICGFRFQSSLIIWNLFVTLDSSSGVNLFKQVWDLLFIYLIIFLFVSIW